MNRPLPWLLIAAFGLTSCEVPESKPFFCGRPSLSVRDEAPAGDVRLRATLYQDDAEPATLTIGYSLDEGETWSVATLAEATQNLESSEEGVKNNFVWDSAADLGKGTFENVSLRAVGFSACGLWDTDQVDGVTIDNSGALAEGCTVAVETPDAPEDGPVVIKYTLSHPDSLAAYVAPSWSSDGGATWSQISLEEGDCDGDGEDDRLSDRSTSPDGVEHCLTWDSQLDFASDEEVIVELACGVGYAEDSTATTDPFAVENDPTPGPNEVIITELQPDYASSGDFLELYNRTDHILNLAGVTINRYKGTIDEDEDPKDFTFDDPTGSVLLYPGDYLLLAETDDESGNGCLEPDVLWGDDFSLSDDSQIQIVLDGEVLTTLDFQEVTGREEAWVFDEGVSLGLDPEKLDSSSWDDFGNWCAQSSTIAECDDYTDELGLGTPGAANDTCP